MAKRSGLASAVTSDLVHHRRALLIYHLFFTILATALLIPAVSWTLTELLSVTGRPAVSNEELFAFAFSPAGIAWALAAGTLAAVLIYMEQAGMMIIAAGSGPPYRRAVLALWATARRLPNLLSVAAIQVGTHIVLTIPFAVALAVAYGIMLFDFDMYFLVRERPPAIWPFLAVAAPLLLLLAACHAALYLRWILALPAVALDRQRPVAALRNSAKTTRGWRLRIAAPVVAFALVITLVPIVVLAAFDTVGSVVLGWLPERFGVLIPATLALLGFSFVLSIALTFLAVAGNSMLINRLYSRARGRPPAIRETPPRRTGFLAWSGELALLGFALAQAAYVLLAFDFEDDVSVIAHRGSSMAAPENTISAIERAVRDGADYVEIDVRASADGTPVLLHDQDLRRVAGIDRMIWDMTDAELARVEVGSWFSPAFRGEPIPTLEEAIEAAGDDIGLYVEIKTTPQTPDLVETALNQLRAHDRLEGTFIGSLQPSVLREVEQLAPEARRTLFVHTAIGRLDRARLDAVGTRAAITSLDTVAAGRRHGHEVHVWTVNDRSAMSRFIDMGVDGIITDRPDALVELLDERAELSDAEMLMVKLRNWVWE